jgi:glycosyltransferase 2 family protein
LFSTAIPAGKFPSYRQLIIDQPKVQQYHARSMKVKALQYVLGVLLGLGLLYFTYRKVALDELWQSLSQVNFWWLLAAQLVSLVAHWIRGLRWQQLLLANGQHVSALHAFCAVMFGYMVNSALPRMGEISRCTILVRTDRIPFATNMGTVVTERAVDVLTLLGLVGIVILAETDRLLGLFPPGTFADSLQQRLTIGLIGLSIGIGLFIWFWRIRTRLMRLPIIGKVVGFIQQLISAVWNIRYVHRPALFVVWSIVIWLLYILSTYCVMLAFEALQGPEWNLYFALIITAMGGIGMAIPIPGGTGSYHAAVDLTFQMFGYATALGTTLALLIHTPQLLLNGLAGGLSYFYLILQQPPLVEPEAMTKS